MYKLQVTQKLYANAIEKCDNLVQFHGLLTLNLHDVSAVKCIWHLYDQQFSSIEWAFKETISITDNDTPQPHPDFITKKKSIRNDSRSRDKLVGTYSNLHTTWTVEELVSNSNYPPLNNASFRLPKWRLLLLIRGLFKHTCLSLYMLLFTLTECT